MPWRHKSKSGDASSLSVTSLQFQNTSERHHSSLSHSKTGRAARGPCDFLGSHVGQTLPLQNRWICAGSRLPPQPCSPRPVQVECPLCVESWSSSKSEPSLCKVRGLQRGWTIVNVTRQQSSGCKLSSLKYQQSKLPGPKLLAGRLRTFHTHNARLPRHAESGQTQLPGPLQDVLPLHLVVNVVTVNPQSAEEVLRPRGSRIFLWSWCCW